MALVKITKDNFEAEVLHSPKTVLVDFWATWCGPCRALTPHLESLSVEMPDLVVGKVDVDSEQELAMKYQVQSIPYLVVFKAGEVANVHTGYCDLERLKALVQ